MHLNANLFLGNGGDPGSNPGGGVGTNSSKTL